MVNCRDTIRHDSTACHAPELADGWHRRPPERDIGHAILGPWRPAPTRPNATPGGSLGTACTPRKRIILVRINLLTYSSCQLLRTAQDREDAAPATCTLPPGPGGHPAPWLVYSRARLLPR